MKKTTIILLLLSLIIPSNILTQLPPDNYKSWSNLVKNKVIVEYSDDFNVPWCRSSTNFRFSQSTIYSALKDLQNYRNIFERVSDSKLLNQNENIAYIRLNMPWPYSDRDYTVKFIESNNGDDIIFQFYSVIHPDTPSNTESVTLPRAAGEWRLIPISENATRVVYTWNGELLGSFPSYGLTTAWETQGEEVLMWLREYLKSRRLDD